MRRRDAAAAFLLLLCAASVLTGLERFPALTGDEAWMALFADRLLARGLYTPHEMNTYTGPGFGLILRESFRWLGASLWSLRLPGAEANVLALFLGFVFMRRRFGAEPALWWTLLLAGSSFWLMKSRLAWEVYALQPLLLSLVFLALEAPAWILAALSLLGAQNHFIFISVPVSLLLLRARALPALLACTALYAVKPRLEEARWAAQRLWALPAFLGLPLLGLLPGWKPRVPGWALAGAAAVGALWHLPPLAQIVAGPVVWKRVLSWDAPWWVDAPLLLWSAFLVALVAWRAVRAWHAREPLSELERLLALWPVAYLAIFLLFRHTSSLRYYSIMHWLFLPAAALGLSRLPAADKRWAAVAAVSIALLNQGVLWREIASPADRRPLEFRVGWRRESSRDFSRKDELFAAFDRSGACRIAHMERSFVSLPVYVHRRFAGDPACDPALSFDADFCRDCVDPPWYRWKVSKE